MSRVISVHRYVLTPKQPIGSLASVLPRQGSLLRVQFEEGEVGYADCFPWPEVGDLDLESQLQLLKKGELTSLTRQSFRFAQVDAQARAQGLSLWAGLEIPPCRPILTSSQDLDSSVFEPLAAQGFTSVKMKGSKNWEAEAEFLFHHGPELKKLGLKICLDFNGSLSWKQIQGFLRALGPVREQIDMIEDPCPYDSRHWAQIQKEWDVRLALDRFSWEARAQLTADSFSILIFKPAIQSMEDALLLAQEFKVTLGVTSYLDHPLGQLCAAWTAAKLAQISSVRLEECGLLTHLAYQETFFSRYIRSHGPKMIPPQGTGFGMDSSLADLEWELL